MAHLDWRSEVSAQPTTTLDTFLFLQTLLVLAYLVAWRLFGF